MDSDEIARAALARGLDTALAAFPQEVVAAIALARAQRDALAEIPCGPSEAK